MKNWTLRTKIMGTIGIILVLLLLISGLAIWILARQNVTANHAVGRLSDAIRAHGVIIYALQAYREQADTIINANADDTQFAKNTAELSALIKQFAELADTAEEKQWASAMANAEGAFAANYQNEVLPRVKRAVAAKEMTEKLKLQDEIKEADGKTDRLRPRSNNLGRCWPKCRLPVFLTASFCPSRGNSKTSKQRQSE